MRLATAYQRALSVGVNKDPAQQAVVEVLDKIGNELEIREKQNRFWSSLTKRFSSGSDSILGLYLWGGVGRGKTFLMDLFYQHLAIERKRRLHFHRFMQMVHEQLWELRGRPDPIESVADQLAEETAVMCFDEFFVSDIGDAMILAELFSGLFSRDVVLIATSNIEPKRLYENGLQRRRFLPTIDLIEKHTQVVQIGGSTDFRLQTLQQEALYRLHSETTPEMIAADFRRLVRVGRPQRHSLTVNKRTIGSEFCDEGVAAFKFKELCETPRNTADYIELARLFHSIVIYDIPQLDSDREDAVRRFIALVDEFYDRNVNVIFNAAVDIDRLYQGERHLKEFERTRSRIREMLSDQYLSKPHRP